MRSHLDLRPTNGVSYVSRTLNQDRGQTCKRTLTRSAGPATSVAGTAENAPAAANSPIDRGEELLSDRAE